MFLAAELLSCSGLWNLAAGSSYRHHNFLMFLCIAFVASLSPNYICFDFSAFASPSSSTFSQMPTLLVSTEKVPDLNLGRETEKVTEVFPGSSQSVESNVKALSTNLIYARFFPHLLT